MDWQEIYLKPVKGEILNSIDLDRNLFQLVVSVPEIADKVKPGQFVNIKVQDGCFPLIRRPYSVWNSQDGVLEFMIKVIGVGSSILYQRKKGRLDLLGPLGKPFPEPPIDKKIILVAGGTGIAPLLFYAKYYSIKNIVVLYGLKTLPSEYIITRIEEITENFYISTEDGSTGFHGTVDLLLKDLISKGEILFSDSLFFLCGPYGMLKALSFLPHDITYVSMEGMMACGFGICMGCAVKKRNKRGYFRTCTEGPAFKLKDIEL